MQKAIPTTNAELVATGNDMSIAANAHQATVPLLHNTKTEIDGDIQPVVDAIMAHGLGKEELKTRRDTTRNLVMSTRSLLMFGRDSFKLDFGTEFNNSWTLLGHDGSLKIEPDEVEVLQFLLIYQDHLSNNPAMEIPSKNFTALHLDALHAQITAARGAVNLQETIVGDLMLARDAKAQKLRKRIRDVINELNMRLDPLDERWLAFGLNKPGADETPDAPEGLQALLIGPGTVAMRWDAAARATHYRVWKKVVGVDADPVAVGSPADIDFTLENLPANSTIEIYVSAVNNGGESARSEKVTIVTH